MNIVLYAIIIAFLVAIFTKANHHQPEWLLLLVILSYVKTCITYLFGATTVFSVLTFGGIEIHLDDLILVIMIGYIFLLMKKPLMVSRFTGATLMLLLPVMFSILRGIFAYSINVSVFLSDIRKFLFFLLAFYAFYFQNRENEEKERSALYIKYVDILMNLIAVYILVIWGLDLFLGINNLPGQINGTMSDGASTFRIVHPGQVLMLALYTLFCMTRDLKIKKAFKFRTLLFMLITILLQWRTVVVAFLVGAIIVVFRHLRKAKISGLLIGEMALVLVGVVAVMRQGEGDSQLGDMFKNLFDSFSSIEDNTGTFSTRVYVWKSILNSLKGIDLWIGKPFGQDLNLSWKASAHSGYVDYIAKMGYVGVAGLIAFMIYILVVATKLKEHMCSLVILVICVYWIGYGFSVEQGALIGFVVGYLERKGREKVRL